MVLGQLGASEKNWTHTSPFDPKIYFKWIKYISSLQNDSVTVLGEATGGLFHDLGVGRVY